MQYKKLMIVVLASMTALSLRGMDSKDQMIQLEGQLAGLPRHREALARLTSKNAAIEQDPVIVERRTALYRESVATMPADEARALLALNALAKTMGRALASADAQGLSESAVTAPLSIDAFQATAVEAIVPDLHARIAALEAAQAAAPAGATE